MEIQPNRRERGKTIMIDKKIEHQMLELLDYQYKKNYKALIDKIKIFIFDKLIEMADKSKDKKVTKTELQVIRLGVQEERDKEKDEELNALTDVINNLIGRFGKEKAGNKLLEEKQQWNKTQWNNK